MAAYEQRSFSEIAVDTTLGGTITDSDTTITLADATGWPTGAGGDFYIAVESEVIRIDTRSSTTLTVQTSGRGALGTTAAAHVSGVDLILAFTSDDAAEANYAVAQTVGTVTAAGDLLTGSGANALQRVALGTTGLPLVAGASTPSWNQLGTTGIADDAVTSAKVAPDAIGSSEIATSAVGTTELADLGVTNGKLAGSIDLAKLATDPLARANHTGTQTLATISDAGTLAALSAIASANITDGTIVNADINASADIALTKLAATAWTSFTPTIGGSGWTIGNATLACAYQQIGKTVHAHYKITWGNGSFGSGTLTFTLPVTADVAGYTCTSIGDYGGSGTYILAPQTSSTSVLSFAYGGTNGIRAGVTNTAPQTWASGHILYADITYQAA